MIATKTILGLFLSGMAFAAALQDHWFFAIGFATLLLVATFYGEGKR